jgi:mono/diheme cytochrome c family protein
LPGCWLFIPENLILKGDSMKLTHLLVFFLILSFTVSLALPAFAADGGDTYKAKCAVCHGPDGAGKIGPALKGTALTADQITDLLTKGNDAKKAPHKKAISGLSADDAKAVAEFVKGLK